MAKGNTKPLPIGDRLTSKESLFYPSVLGESWKNVDPEVRWDLGDVVNHVFPRRYQERSHSHAVKLLGLVMENPKGVGKTALSAFFRDSQIPEATAYNVIIPKLVRFGLVERRRETNATNPSKGWFMVLKPSTAFSSHLSKLAAEWRSIYKTAEQKTDKE